LACHRYRRISRILKNELPDLNADFLDPKSPEKMGREIVSECFQKLGRLPRQKLFRLLTERRIVDRPRDCVLDVTEVARWPQSNVEDKTLALCSFGSRNSDPGKDFELFDVNLLLGANSHYLSPTIAANDLLIEKFRFW
jgi:hypothetical protein